MTELKQLEIAYKFCDKLIKESTGTSYELAKHLGITPAWVTTYKRKIEYVYNVEINYCRRRKTYYLNKNKKTFNAYLELI